MRKILTFPTPYPNELFYGTVARYQRYTGVALSKICEELFRSRQSTFDVTTNLADLCEQLGKPYSPELILNNHSLYSVYAPLVTKKSQDIAFNNLLHGNGFMAIKHLKIPSIKTGNRAIMYCPECASYDLDKYGEVYIHKEHQIPDILCCYKHGNYLVEYNEPGLDLNKFIYLNPEYIKLSTYAPKRIQAITQMAVDFMNSHLEGFQKNDFVARFRTLIKEYGYIKSSRTNIQLLSDDILKHYGSPFLARYHCLPDYNLEIKDEYNPITAKRIKKNTSSNTQHWLQSITRQTDTYVDLMKYLLLINFFGLNLSEFLEISPEYRELTNNKKSFGRAGADRRRYRSDDEILGLLKKAHKKRMEEKPYGPIEMATLFRMIGMYSWQYHNDTLTKSILYAKSACQSYDEAYFKKFKDLVNESIADGLNPTLDMILGKFGNNNKSRKDWFNRNEPDLLRYIIEALE